LGPLPYWLRHAEMFTPLKGFCISLKDYMTE
jgi:hypothetical protein